MNILFYTGCMAFHVFRVLLFFKRRKGIENLLVCSAGLGHCSHLPTHGHLELSHRNSELVMLPARARKIKSKLQMP